MRIGGADFPEPLLNTLRDGWLVVLAGAGVSMGPPANLPGFPERARQVAEGTGLSIGENEAEDRFLGRLKEVGPDVHCVRLDHFQNPPKRAEVVTWSNRLCIRLSSLRRRIQAVLKAGIE